MDLAQRDRDREAHIHRIIVSHSVRHRPNWFGGEDWSETSAGPAHLTKPSERYVDQQAVTHRVPAQIIVRATPEHGGKNPEVPRQSLYELAVLIAINRATDIS